MSTPLRLRRGVIAIAGCLLATTASVAACSSSTQSPAATRTSPAPTPSGLASTGCPNGTSVAGAPGAADVTVPGDIPDNQAYVTYPSPDGYHISVPEGWARSQAGHVIAFTDKFNSIRVEVTAQAAAPSASSTQAVDVPALATSVTCFQAGKVTQVSRKAGPVVLVTYRANSPADPVTGKVVRQDVERYAFWQSGQKAVVTLSSPIGSDNVDPWRRVTDSFAWGA